MDHTSWQEAFLGLSKEKMNMHTKPIGLITKDWGMYFEVMTEFGAFRAHRGDSFHLEEEAVIGDFVLGSLNQEYYQIESILQRKSQFSRKKTGKEIKAQIIAANMDYIFLVQSLNQDFNLRRLERYLISAWESGATPVVLLTKKDLCEDAEQKKALVSEVAFGIDIHAISAETKENLSALDAYLKPGKMSIFLGSSGVGKSTLINTLMGEEVCKTKEIRTDDAKGKHTTTHKEIFLLPQGGLIMDTPGMRSFELWEGQDALGEVFADIEALSHNCKFRDCKHEEEPGCKVKEALKEGRLSQKRWESFQKLQRELDFLERKKSTAQMLADKKKMKMRCKNQKRNR